MCLFFIQSAHVLSYFLTGDTSVPGRWSGKLHLAATTGGMSQFYAHFIAQMLVCLEQESAQFVPQLLQFPAQTGQIFWWRIPGIAKLLQFRFLLPDALPQAGCLPAVVVQNALCLDSLLGREPLHPGLDARRIFGSGAHLGCGATLAGLGKARQRQAEEQQGRDGQKSFAHVFSYAKSGQKGSMPVCTWPAGRDSE